MAPRAKPKKSFVGDMRSFLKRNRGLRYHGIHGPITQSALTGPEVIYKLHLDNLSSLRGRDLNTPPHPSRQDGYKVWDDRIPKSYVTDMQRQLLKSKINRSKQRVELLRQGHAFVTSDPDMDDASTYEEELSYLEELQKLEQSLPRDNQMQEELRCRQQLSLKLKAKRRMLENKRTLAEISRKISRVELRDKHRRAWEKLARQQSSDTEMLRSRIDLLQSIPNHHLDPQVMRELTHCKFQLAEKELDQRSDVAKMKRSHHEEMNDNLPQTSRVQRRRVRRECRLVFNKMIQKAVETEKSLKLVKPLVKFHSQDFELRKKMPIVLSRRRKYSAAFNEIYLSALPSKKTDDCHEDITESNISPSQAQKPNDSKQDHTSDPSKRAADERSHTRFVSVADLSQRLEQCSIIEHIEDEILNTQPVSDVEMYDQFSTDELAPPVTFSCTSCQGGNDATGVIECLCKYLFN